LDVVVLIANVALAPSWGWSQPLFVLSRNLKQIWYKFGTIFVAGAWLLPNIPSLRALIVQSEMMKADSSYQGYLEDGQIEPGEDRLPLGLSLLLMFGLSALGWAAVLTPLITTFSK
jgi:hypothetical protein